MSVTITQPTAITASAVQDSPVTCFGESNGSATVTAANGNGGYTYLWDNGETTATATALNAGTHTVTITDSKGCKLENVSVTITQPDAITASAVQDSPVTCFGESNGSATATAANGNGGYTYLWDNGETTATATALNAGVHTVTITDSKGCKLENVSVTITQPTAITASIATVTDVLCNSEATGSIDITVVGG
ncbi:SprB repeat-containing protein, partial [Algibacter lectus]|uniref:SprB repeat-containing protein n=1 Tax=Algibacter lectus TaxID=221126 RepID=UPI0034E3A8B4